MEDQTDTLEGAKPVELQCEVPGCGKTFYNEPGEGGKTAIGQLKGHMIHHTRAKKQKAYEEEARKTRVPFGTTERKFGCPENDGFHYRVFNDNWAKEPGRIVRAERAGYTICENAERHPVGTNEDGSAITGVLMRIPQKIYDEDQAEKQKVVDRVDEQILRGNLEAKPGDKRYSPAGISITSSFNENP